MSDVVNVCDGPTPEEKAEKKLAEHLLTLWRQNTVFHRAVEMDKLMVVNRGESFYCTRFIGDDGETLYDGPMGPTKGDAKPGYYVRFTQHHTVAYQTWRGMANGCEKGGYVLADIHWKELRTKGVTFITNGMDNRLRWAMSVDRKTRDLLRAAGHKVNDILHGDEPKVQIGDYLCVEDEEVEVKEGVVTRYKLRLNIGEIRSKAYGNERFRWLHNLI